VDAYSEDLRRKIVEAVEQWRMNNSEAARAFGVISLSSVKRYAKAVHEEGRSLSPGKAPGKRPTLDTKARRLLQTHVEERPFGGASVRQALREAGVPAEGGRGFGERIDPLAHGPFDGLWPKKRTLGASERDEFLGAAFRVMVISSIDPERFVFVEECSTNTKRWHPFTDGRLVESGRTRKLPATGART
jgi:hypothetical protein